MHPSISSNRSIVIHYTNPGEDLSSKWLLANQKTNSLKKDCGIFFDFKGEGESISPKKRIVHPSFQFLGATLDTWRRTLKVLQYHRVVFNRKVGTSAEYRVENNIHTILFCTLQVHQKGLFIAPCARMTILCYRTWIFIMTSVLIQMPASGTHSCAQIFRTAHMY